MTLDADPPVEAIASRVLGCAMKVHTELGPGLLESAYEICLHRELSKVGMRSERQLALPIAYDGERLDAGYRLDLLVEELVVVEIKSVDRLLPIHTAQVLTYLRLGGFPPDCY